MAQLALALCALLQLGCAASLAPRGFLPYAEEAQQEAYGGWLDMAAVGGGEAPHIRGELLAITEDSVYTLSAGSVTPTSLDAVRSATLEVYDPRFGRVSLIAVLGVLGTVTHGVALIATAPLWVIVGTASSAALSRQGKHHIAAPAWSTQASDTSATASRRASWRDLRLYARFPQGLPSGLDRTLLHERPAGRQPKPVQSDPGSI